LLAAKKDQVLEVVDNRLPKFEGGPQDLVLALACDGGGKVVSTGNLTPAAISFVEEPELLGKM
jgi:hypothetical protein